MMFLNIAMQLRDSFYKLVALGLGTCYIFQIFLTIGGVTKFIPSTGVTLPLVSYGGTSVLSTIIMFAIIQGLYVLREDEEEDIERKNYREDELPDLDQQLESLPDESGYHDQKKKAEGKSRKQTNGWRTKEKGRTQPPKNGQRRPKETQAERSGASKKKEKQMTNKELTRVTYIFVTLFLVLMGYLVYFNVVKSKEVVNSTYNIRQDLLADRVLRGSITDKNGEVLAQTVTNDDGSETREYPEGEVFAHVVGYAAKGKSGLESSQNFNLLTSNAFFPGKAGE